MDNEQIWEQMKLHFDPLLKALNKQVDEEFADAPKDVELLSLIPQTEEQQSGEEEEEDFEEDEEEDGLVDDDDLDMEDEMEEDEDLEEDDDEVSQDFENEEEDEEDNEDLEEDEDEEEQNGKKKKRSSKDRFFSLNDMERFIEEEEEKEFDDEEGGEEDDEEDDEEEDDAVIGQFDDDDNAEDLKYSDFFDPESGQQAEEDDDEVAGVFDEEDGDNLDEDDMDEMEDNDDDATFWRGAQQGKSKTKAALFSLMDEQEQREEFEKELGEGYTAFQRRAKKVKEQIGKLEEANVAEKPWMLKGEINSKQRPVNSLLEAELDYETTSKATPVITEEVARGLEEIIKKRIVDESYDDVIRKKMELDDKGFKARFELDQEKSKVGLGEIYEQEYLQKVMGAEKEDPLKEKHDEIDKIFRSVCAKLDALSNFNFTPKIAKPDVSIKTVNAPAITMEEITPITTSTSSLLAPEEVYQPTTKSKLKILGGVKAESELTQEDRKKIRKNKKKAAKLETAKKEMERKLKEKLDPEAAKRRVNSRRGKEEAYKKIVEQKNTKIVSGTTNSENTTTSTALFKKLQEESKKEVKGKAGEKKESKKKDSAMSSNFLKL